jgi:hypothetical protein
MKQPAVIATVTLMSMPEELTFVNVRELETVEVLPQAGHAVVVQPAIGQGSAAVPQLNVQLVAAAGEASANAAAANSNAKALRPA